MENNKETGSYYTPYELIKFMIKYLKEKEQNFTNVLEPSAGDGRFLSALLSLSTNVTAVEVNGLKVEDIRAKYEAHNLEVKESNFLDYVMDWEGKYSLIIGNPPYINPKNMEKTDIEKAKIICKEENLETSVMQNMWLAFVVGACRLLDSNGSIFFVLPMEFLQVQYAEKLRKYLEKKFNTIHILTFEVPVFPEIEQDVCLVYMTNRRNENPYISYEIYADMMTFSPIYENKIKKYKPLKKWTNAILSDEDIMLIKNKRIKYKTIEEMGNSAPGIVTGGNKFFILNSEKLEKLNCKEYVIPILQKSSYISENTIFIDTNVVDSLQRKNKPMYLLDLSGVKYEEMPIELQNYLEWAKEQEIGEIKLKKRYKCANRKPWYGVPIVNKGDVVFFKRYHIVPRVYINEINIHTTDAGYHMKLHPEYDKKSFVFCFFNSLTLAQCEFEGRYYGGGVSELVPSEFKQLQIPYQKIKDEDIYQLEKMFGEKMPLETIVSFVNEKTIAKDMTQKEIDKIEHIRKKLIQRRNKK